MPAKRCSGILFHPTCLPGPYGIGTLGEEALRFVDFLAEAGQSLWQVLPLGPTGFGDSPYSAFSAFAGNPLLLCPETLVANGDLEAGDLQAIRRPEGEIDYAAVQAGSRLLLQRAARRFRSLAEEKRRQAFERFCAENAGWLEDYALFQALKGHFNGRPWNQWPADIGLRKRQALGFWQEQLEEALYCQRFIQFCFFEQWHALKRYASSRGIQIIGDLPFYICYDSADVWANRHLFHLDGQGRPTVLAGVPPDYFSSTGQLWGNPLYRWERLAQDGYRWWQKRLTWQMAQTDLMRIDHFRGFSACWGIAPGETEAVSGRWHKGPGAELFRALEQALGKLPVIAEDLGVITPDVERLRDTLEIPGMRVLQFAFDGAPDNPHLPRNLPGNCVVYTGTHDNDTVAGWWTDLSAIERRRVHEHLGNSDDNIARGLVESAMDSRAERAIFPLQDLLGLGGSARMNRPGRCGGNWRWRLPPGVLTGSLAANLADLTGRCGR